MFPWTSNSTCLASSPCTRLSRAPSTTSEVRLPPSHLSPSGLTIRLTYSARFRQTKTAVDLPGAMTLPFLSMPCSQTPPDSPATIAFIGRLLLPSRFSTLSASGCPCHEARSLHLCYGLDIALSTLNSCRCLHEPKTRFPVGRLFPFPGRESHPLKAPGLPWRTEENWKVLAS